MSDSMKTYKITCCHCKQPFHVRFPEVDPDAEGTGDVVIDCQYCGGKVVARLPRKYIRTEHMVRGLESRPA